MKKQVLHYIVMAMLMALPQQIMADDVVINSTNFPDDNFRNIILSWDIGKDGVLTDMEIESVTIIDAFSEDISDLKGIEFFTALEILWCYNNQLTTLDVSKNTKLNDLECSNNQLTSLDVSNNLELKVLECSFNQLTSLDVSKNTALEMLLCDDNQLTSLDVSKNTALEHLSCSLNQLISLDVSKNTELWLLDCWGNQLTTLNLSKNTELYDLDCEYNYLTTLDVSGCKALRRFSCPYNNLTTLDVSKNTELFELYCADNQLTSLNVSGCTALEWLNCGGNNLTALNVSKNTALESLYCDYNQLTSIDVSKNIALTELYCSANKIKGTEMDELIAGLQENGGSLYAISPDYENEQNVVTKAQVTAAKKRGWTTYYYSDESEKWLEYEGSDSTTEGIVIGANLFPDFNFRRWILTQDYGSDGVLTDDEIASVTEINVDGENIASLKGIEYFTALKELDCSENKLTTLDVSKNTALRVLYCNDNQLTSLNVSGCTALTWLYCQYNNLTALDVSKNTALKELYCHGNLLTALNVSGCKALTRLECEVNKLTTLNVSGCTALVWLDCGGNNLTSLNVSKNTALEWLACDYNQLASLDVSKNKALTGLYCSANKIKGTEMDALIAGLQEKGGSFYAISPDFDNEQNVVTKAQVAAAKKKGWTTYYYSDESEHWFEYEGSEEQTISPVNEGETIDIGSEIDANTNLNGNVVGDVYYNISSGNGSYNTAEGCITVTKPTDDNAIDGQDIFSDDFQDNYTGIVFIVPSGNGTIKVEAQTTGSLVLKVKIGDNAPREMVLNDKEKASFPYNVSEDTFVYIYAGAKAAGAKGMRKASGNGELKIYGIEIVSGTDSLDNLTISQLDDSPVYNLNGQKVDGMPTNKGVYIKDGKKVLVK